MDFKALTKMQYGIYIISAASEGKASGQVANAVIQVTSDPVQFAACVSKKNFTCELIEKSGKFAMSAISQDAPFEFLGKFGFRSGRDVNKFENVEHITSASGIPVVTAYATAVYELDVVSKTDTGSHIIFIGKVTDMKVIDDTKETMTYEYYHKVKGGMTAKNAPTYVKTASN